MKVIITRKDGATFAPNYISATKIFNRAVSVRIIRQYDEIEYYEVTAYGTRYVFTTNEHNIAITAQ